MKLQIDVTDSKGVSKDDIRSLPAIHPDGSVTRGDEGDAWIVVNRTLGDFDVLVDIE